MAAGWISITPPLRSSGAADAAGSDARPSVLLVAEHDQFTDPDAARAATDGWTNTEMHVIAGTDHFLAGRMGPVGELVQLVLSDAR